MSVDKIIRLLAIAVVVIAAFVTIPYAALIITLLGLAAGWFISTEEESIRIRFMLSLLVLFVVNESLGDIPAIGEYLNGILGNLSALYNAGGVSVVVMGLINRMKAM